jgi:hypothetical protein
MLLSRNYDRDDHDKHLPHVSMAVERESLKEGNEMPPEVMKVSF